MPEDLRPYARELLHCVAARDAIHREYIVGLARKYGLTEAEIEAESCSR
jgi:hypothetical protein